MLTPCAEAELGRAKMPARTRIHRISCVFTFRSHFAAIHRHEHYDFMTARIVGRNNKYAAQKVTVKGTLQGEILTVESVSPAK